MLIYDVKKERYEDVSDTNFISISETENKNAAIKLAEGLSEATSLAQIRSAARAVIEEKVE